MEHVIVVVVVVVLLALHIPDEYFMTVLEIGERFVSGMKKYLNILCLTFPATTTSPPPHHVN